ncbi:MAG: serine hydrolase domain-containing protein [Gammaproteobacteria bacterium]|jgi:CubicO group peptidase (beta-lactamase class C family)|nr:beta-lactamase [Gammaproteobacteria bacterium]MDP6094477.1 serine hydrolase domain-containing protein [Gammaproteobacteria bacterium]HJO10645.1 serine hydrolase domain-containing protein [Gammaproteobacteria bacterium]|tara:strand:- start:160 stop:1431 length:1272 start_codon:yes stop_codon:yes gene_type:complete
MKISQPQSIFLPLLLLALALPATAQTTTDPESVGLSESRLDRIADLVDRYIVDDQIAGAITVVARHGETAYFKTQGVMDIEAREAMRPDAIFRMASMSKPVTGVAIMMLLEEGRLRLEDPVSRFIPEFQNTQVAMLKDDSNRIDPTNRNPDIYTVPASREITVRDLLTHTSGLESGGAGSRVGSRIAPRDTSLSLAEYIPTLGDVPLDFQPGTKWRYSSLAGIETLGHIVEVVSGLTFDQFLQERIFEPLGMRDTSFVVPADKMPRLVTLYESSDAGTLERQDDNPGWLDTTTLFSGGGGLYSTADDYMRFGQMLLNGGELNGNRLLGLRTVQLMASNHVGDLYGPDAGRANGLGFGLTVEVVLDPVLANTRRGKGSFGWGGAFGTYFWVDPENDIVALLMIQTRATTLRSDFANAVGQAIVE